MEQTSILTQHKLLFRNSIWLRLIALIAIITIGQPFWIQQIADISRSSSSVYAQSTKKKTFSEDVSMQFFVAKDYTTTVEGVIELTNSSGKDISLTQYDMNLPYFTLKNTKIESIYPKAFLVDMYSQNNSILFTFKSQYTKPVVIGKNAKIIFTFSALVDKPFRDIGGLRTLIFPFTMTEEDRNLRITVSVNKDLPLISAPQVAKPLHEKRIYTVNAETGKVFLFSKTEAPISMTFAHSAEVFLPYFGETRNCSLFEPISCLGCGTILTFPESKEVLAQRNSDSKLVAFQFSKTIQTACAQNLMNTLSTPTHAGKTFEAGYIISPLSNQLIPATWRVDTSKEGSYATSFIAQGVPYFYADPYGFLSIPLFSCTSDNDCRARSEKLLTIDTTLSTVTEKLPPGVSDNPTTAIKASVIQQGRQFLLELRNSSEQFFSINHIELRKNTYFSLDNTTSKIIPPQSSVELLLTNNSTVQFSNQNIDLPLQINDTPIQLRFKPITITILAVIEVLTYLFIVSLGITVVSMIGIILYTHYYERKKTTPVT